MEKAKWIWDAKAAVRDGVEICYFRKTFKLPGEPTAASVLITADNGYQLHVNGSVVGDDSGFDTVHWQSVEKYDIRHLLTAGDNVIAVRGTNLGGPAGLIAAVRVDVKGAAATTFHTDSAWRIATGPQTGWSHKEFDAATWTPAVELGPFGMLPWQRVQIGGRRPAASPGRGDGQFTPPGEDFRWPEGVVFLSGRVPESSTRSPQSIWRINGSRAYLEFDTPGPSVPGRKMYALRPVGPKATPRLLLDAGGGLLGSPTVSYDGGAVYFTMAPEGEKFYQIYRLAVSGTAVGEPERLTDGPFHHYDPAELPDGRIVFASTRIGTRDEYHGNVARALCVMDSDGSNIRPLTHHIVADNEPRVTADGLIAFVRCDNFLERAKVETQIHVIRPDGTAGQVLLGADRGAIAYDRPTAAEGDSRWLRRYGFGSPAPLPDGRVASLSSFGLVVSAAGGQGQRLPTAMRLLDIAPLPDGRLLCTAAGRLALGVLDIQTGQVVRLPTADVVNVHSPAFLGPRPRPLRVHDGAENGGGTEIAATGWLYCQNVFNSRQTAADWSRVRAVRVYEGVALTNRSGRHVYAHIGVEGAELGTVPLAPDGSFYAEVPADRALALQAVDAEGRSVINELSWIYVRPGERRSCVGCHGPRQSARVDRRGPHLAATAAPVKLLGAGTRHRFRANNAANGGVLNLQLDRFREVAAINLYACAPPGEGGAAMGPGRAMEVRRLIGQLKDGDANEKVSAARRLAILRDRSAGAALAVALRDGDASVRMNAALALAACGGREAAPALTAALDDPSPAVAQAADVALGNLTGHTEGFNAYRRGRGAARRRAWLQGNDWDAIERAAIARLGGDDLPARHAAAVTLGRIGGEAARGALREFVRNDKGGDLRATLAAMRSLGYLADREAVGLLGEGLTASIKDARKRHKGFHELGWWQRPAHLAAGAAEALGRIGTPPAEKALIAAFGQLAPFWNYTVQTGDHSWLMGCNASVVHHRILEALDAIGSTGAGAITPAVLTSVPIDSDRGLLYENDSYELLTARVVHRSGRAGEVVATCLAVLGDEKAKGVAALRPAVTASPPATTFGPLSAESRAALILSVVCHDRRAAPAVRAAFERYRAQAVSKKRSWTCFYLARLLGRLGDPAAADVLTAALTDDPTEASFGRPDPPNVYVHNAMTPCYRAAAADALGRLGHKPAVAVLLAIVADLDNAVDVRHAAAGALARIADPASLPGLKKLARGDHVEVVVRRALRQAVANAGGGPASP